MVWLTFTISAALIVLAAIQLAKYGDVIAIRTRLGGMFIGVLLLAGATSLPEVLTTISALYYGAAQPGRRQPAGQQHVQYVPAGDPRPAEPQAAHCCAKRPSSMP